MRWAVLVGVTTTIFVLGLLSLFYTVAADAKARGSDAWLSWGITAVFVPFGPGLYLLYRSQIGERTASLTDRERLAGTGSITFLVAFVSGAVLSPPDPFTQLLYTALSVPVGLLVGYLLVWRGKWSPRRVLEAG
jgi:cell division protein FtsW (lipid II flippase)